MSIIGALDKEVSAAPQVRAAFVEWRPSYHKAIGKQTTTPMDRWGWDFLPLMDAYFWWSTDKKAAPAGSGSVSVVAWHQSDSGYEHGDDEPDPAGFEPVEKSATDMHVHAYVLVSGGCASTWTAIDERFEEEDGVDFESGVVLTAPTDGLSGVDAGTVIRYVGWTVPLADLATEDDVEKKLLAPLRDHLANMLVP